jgi:hypothetical protein
MSAGQDLPASPKRRWFLKTAVAVGVVGGALGGGMWWNRGFDKGRMTPAGEKVFRGVARGVLAQMLPAGAERDRILNEHMQDLERLYNNLPSAKRDQINLVASLLANAPTRYLAVGMWTSWDQASDEQIQQVLRAMQQSEHLVPNVLFSAVRALTVLCFFSQPTHWNLTGYPGPMSI